MHDHICNNYPMPNFLVSSDDKFYSNLQLINWQQVICNVLFSNMVSPIKGCNKKRSDLSSEFKQKILLINIFAPYNLNDYICQNVYPELHLGAVFCIWKEDGILVAQYL